jgi:hypothetical protein
MYELNCSIEIKTQINLNFNNGSQKYHIDNSKYIYQSPSSVSEGGSADSASSVDSSKIAEMKKKLIRHL